MYTLLWSGMSRRTLRTISASSWVASDRNVIFIKGGRSFCCCFGKRNTRCICAGSIPSSDTSWRANVVSFLFISILRSESLHGAPVTTTERLSSSASECSLDVSP